MSADITASFAAKDSTREEYYKARYHYEEQRDRIHHIQFLQEQKERIVRRVEEDKEEAARREQQIKDLQHPYAKEIETCISLEQYCHQLKRKAGLEVDSEELAKATQQNLLSELNREQVQKRLEAGKIMSFESKQDREAAAMIKIGGGKKQKGKKEKKVEYEDIFSLDVVIIQKFGLI